MRISIAVLILCVMVSCGQEKKYHDAKPNIESITKSDKLADILLFQEELNAEFKNPESSPLPDRFRIDFESLEFFEPDTNYIVEAELVRTPEALPFSMPTTTGRESTEVVYGIAKFTLNGKDHKLEIYQSPELITQAEYEDYLFLPFTDNTNGEETYGGGRYLDLRIPKGNKIILNFNKAYNPYCAYNKKFSCPIVPKVNNLDTEIKVGVKAFEH
ncbi:MAG: DUF1684 domain-containing protein [Maribacter dokdonensis]|uniref:DUF1684 domain-containing protein n=2 Tax=Flavobacteriaceae TaxID=49546 RepID=A0ABY0UMB5_9FLAO|nr:MULTISPECIES: DUF1684 domain-containing protein [Maribacter]APA66392.1 hypothetical protein YQ22_13135 [Maribacter sp. 1_2014MBL_MicDiv]PHN95602.1 DUF1684 domain-containing protein [Maribacter sp. 6B07]CAG2531409.1 hypothetical protein MAR621_01935 [Maribacter dokdonensis]SDS90532.1 hypothetical protein SAMN05192545_2319 [Maribacter dokdonensis]